MANRGIDFDFDLRERASALGQAIADNGPGALFDEVETLIPDHMREVIRAFPLLAVAAGVGAGVWLGMRKSDEVIAAATSLVTAAVMANVSQAMQQYGGGGEATSEE